MSGITEITIKVTMVGAREWCALSDYDGDPPVRGLGPTAAQAIEAWTEAFYDREISKALADRAARSTARRAAARKSAAARTRRAIGGA